MWFLPGRPDDSHRVLWLEAVGGWEARLEWIHGSKFWPIDRSVFWTQMILKETSSELRFLVDQQMSNKEFINYNGPNFSEKIWHWIEVEWQKAPKKTPSVPKLRTNQRRSEPFQEAKSSHPKLATREICFTGSSGWTIGLTVCILHIYIHMYTYIYQIIYTYIEIYVNIFSNAYHTWLYVYIYIHNCVCILWKLYLYQLQFSDLEFWYIKLVGQNGGTNPKSHSGYGEDPMNLYKLAAFSACQVVHDVCPTVLHWLAHQISNNTVL